MVAVFEGLPDHQLIVGCTRDSQIHAGAAAFTLLANGLYDRLLTLADVKFMVACGVSESWKNLLDYPPLCGIDKHGTFCFVKDGLCQPVTTTAETKPDDAASH